MNKFYELFFEVPYLLSVLGIIEAKCFSLRLKTSILAFRIKILDFKFRILLFQRRILVVGKRNAFLEYGRRSMFIDKFFKSVKKSHIVPPA